MPDAHDALPHRLTGATRVLNHLGVLPRVHEDGLDAVLCEWECRCLGRDIEDDGSVSFLIRGPEDEHGLVLSWGPPSPCAVWSAWTLAVAPPWTFEVAPPRVGVCVG